jgi:hypothetical protein
MVLTTTLLTIDTSRVEFEDNPKAISLDWVSAGIGNQPTITKTMAKAESQRPTIREKKRHRIRQQLQRLNVDPQALRRIFADHIRAIRYLRIRNEEVATLNMLYRLQQNIRSRISETQGQGSTIQQQQRATQRNKRVKLVEWKPRD